MGGWSGLPFSVPRWQVEIKSVAVGTNHNYSGCVSNTCLHLVPEEKSSPTKPKRISVVELKPALGKHVHTGKLGEVQIAGGQTRHLLPCELCLFLLGVIPGPLGKPAILHTLPQIRNDALNPTIRVSPLGLRPPFIPVKVSTSAKSGRVEEGKRALGFSARWKGRRRVY